MEYYPEFYFWSIDFYQIKNMNVYGNLGFLKCIFNTLFKYLKYPAMNIKQIFRKEIGFHMRHKVLNTHTRTIMNTGSTLKQEQ